WLAPAIGGEPLVTLRVVLDTHRHELHRPLRTLHAAARAYRTLREACALVHDWAQALGPREVLLAAPRASCAGVERAVEVAERGLEVIDATCPLVAKVHAEARRFASAGMDIVLVGHEGHEEVEGTSGEAPGHTHVIANAEEVDSLEISDPAKVAYLTQTTLAVDDTADVVERLRERFPGLVGPPSSDICYATQNRQDAVRALAGECDIVLVVGSANSSNSRRLVEVSERAGCPALLVENGGDIPPERVVGARRVGLTARASAPEALVEGVVRALAGLGGAAASERSVAQEE